MIKIIVCIIALLMVYLDGHIRNGKWIPGKFVELPPKIEEKLINAKELTPKEAQSIMIDHFKEKHEKKD